MEGTQLTYVDVTEAFGIESQKPLFVLAASRADVCESGHPTGKRRLLLARAGNSENVGAATGGDASLRIYTSHDLAIIYK